LHPDLLGPYCFRLHFLAKTGTDYCGQVFWLTAQSTSCAFPFAERRTVALKQVSSPITAAGPRRNRTALPYYLPDEDPQKHRIQFEGIAVKFIQKISEEAAGFSPRVS
jgi:hypothetical protein